MMHATHWKMNVCEESGPLDFQLVLKHRCLAIDNMPACCFTSFLALYRHHTHTHTNIVVKCMYLKLELSIITKNIYRESSVYCIFKWRIMRSATCSRSL